MILSFPQSNHLLYGGRFFQDRWNHARGDCSYPWHYRSPCRKVLSREAGVRGARRSKGGPGQVPALMQYSGSGGSGRFLIRVMCTAVILAGLLVAPALAAPTLAVSPSSGKAGAKVTVTGSSFDLYAVEFPQADVFFNGVEVVHNVWFTGTGFSTTFQIPVNTPPGTYTVQAVGPRDSATTTFTVGSPPDAGFLMSPSSGMGKAPLTMHFTDTSTGNPYSWKWAFGDGSTSSQQNPVHNYPSTGTYTITLTVSNAAGSNSESRSVTAYIPALVLSPSSGKAGTKVTVTGNSFCLYAVQLPQATISFDGLTAPVSVPITPNGNLGSFATSFTVPAGTAKKSYVIRAEGPHDSAESTFTVTSTAPHALIDASPQSGETPLSVHFIGTRSYDEDGSIGSYQWDFSDGTSATGGTTDHRFTRSGEYHVVLTVTDNDQQSGTESVTITAENAPPVAEARASPTSGSAPLTVNFDGSQSYDPDGTIESYHWDFGDGSREQTANASHQYQNLQSYTAVLTVTDDKKTSDTDEILITVGNEPPVAVLSVRPGKGPKPLLVTFDGSQSNDPENTSLNFTWEFGDGGSGSGITAAHTYEKEGTYLISLLVTDPYGASARAETTVEVETPFPWEIPVLAIVILGGGMISWHYLRRPGQTVPPEQLPPDWRFPESGVHVDIKSGIEHPVGFDRTKGQLPDISVDVRSGIWKEEDDR